MDPKHMTHEEIKHLVFVLPDLHQDQRDTIKSLLMRLADGDNGKIWPKALHEALLRLREAYAITEFDKKNIEMAVFS